MALWVFLQLEQEVLVFRNSVLKHPQALLALIFSSAYCIAFLATILVPSIQFNEVLSRSFERILLVVVSFYFGAKERANITNQERQQDQSICVDCNKGK